MASTNTEKNGGVVAAAEEGPSPAAAAVPTPVPEGPDAPAPASAPAPALAEKGGMSEVIRSARLATEKEHKMTLLQGIKLYPKAIGWSILISTCIVMEGYDIALVNNFYAFPQFNKKYGELFTNADGSTEYQVPAAWQAGLGNGAVVGEIIGLMINGWCSERFGYRYTVIGCLAMIIGFTAIFFTAQTVVHLQIAEILCGIPWGVFQTLTITYASEVCPVALRGYLTTYINCCWGIGQMIGIGALMGNLWRTDEWAYRIPYALQWIWPLPLIVGIFFAPESPWWLVRNQRLEDAKQSLLRLTSLDKETDFDANETIAMMVHTTALEQKITKGASYADCFKGVDRRRTEIVCACWAIQNLSGNTFSNYSTYFLQQAGLDDSKAYSFALGQYAINCVGVFGAWALITLGVGRRTLYLYGLAGLFLMLLILGFLGLAPDREAASLATGSIMLVNIVGIVCGVLTPYMLNPSSWNWGNYAGFFWAGSCFLCLIYTYFRVPEPAGRTFAELDLLFEKKISARKFATTNVDVFAETIDGDVLKQYQDQIAISHMEHGKKKL
ncbi:Uu.00g103540.m01.CDS01 [Anthostomella pinea]|uniref:Uu.00g103540.m01.CDS01 n=1 Tax=Anthostomella pinea TaxID=933095 RepID=A0AAI8VDF5_9PEZI|nr:Uu.00g103540.m01.CDS01 [Anthostomella pinea]